MEGRTLQENGTGLSPHPIPRSRLSVFLFPYIYVPGGLLFMGIHG